MATQTKQPIPPILPGPGGKPLTPEEAIARTMARFPTIMAHLAK